MNRPPDSHLSSCPHPLIFPDPLDPLANVCHERGGADPVGDSVVESEDHIRHSPKSGTLCPAQRALYYAGVTCTVNPETRTTRTWAPAGMAMTSCLACSSALGTLSRRQ